MTLILSLQGQSSIWICADRRLTYPDRIVDNAVKLLDIEGRDGRAFLGYAGLGKSKSRTEPSGWMNDILKGKPGLPIEQQLSLVSSAMRDDLSNHLHAMPGEKSHVVVAPAVIDGVVRLYQLSVALSENAPLPQIIFTHHENERKGGPPPFAVTGSGAHHLLARKGWHREILRTLRGVEAGRVNPRAVADRLAQLNRDVAACDSSVSRKCIVKWWAGSGGYQFYGDDSRVEGDAAIPMVANGMDLQDIARAVTPISLEAFADIRAGGVGDIDPAAMQAALEREYLRPNRKL